MSRSERMMNRMVREFVGLRDQERQLKERKESMRDSIKEWMLEDDVVVEVDHEGHLWFDLPEPVQSGGKTYTKIKNERHVSRYIDDEKLFDLAEEKGFLRRVIKFVEQVDHDELYVLYQEGLITEEELDSVFTESVSWALKPEV